MSARWAETTVRFRGQVVTGVSTEWDEWRRSFIITVTLDDGTVLEGHPGDPACDDFVQLAMLVSRLWAYRAPLPKPALLPAPPRWRRILNRLIRRKECQ